MDERIETEGIATVPYYVHESSMARAERLNKRMFILCIIELLIIVAMAAGFFLYEAQYQDIIIEQDVESEDSTVVTNGMGDVNYGFDARQTKDPDSGTQR